MINLMEVLESPQCHDPEEIAKILGTSQQGLAEVEVARRLAEFGKNMLEEERTSRLSIFIRQFKNILIYILIIASFITILVGEWKDFIVIIALVMANSVIGFYQELKAEASISALKKLTESKVNVIRGGVRLSIPSSELVPGDVTLLSEGDMVSADIRLFESSGLMVDEATITGESVPVSKDHSLILDKASCSYELRNMLLSGTTVVRGNGRGYVVRTGRKTYLASIAEKAKESSPESPLTRALKAFMKRYVVLLLLLFTTVGVVGYLQGRDLLDLAYLLVAQLVSAVPEGLPLVVTVVMVVGALALSRKKTLTRFLPSVETLGSATVIASDKTGTITEGKLKVQDVFAIDSEGLRLAAALCNDSDQSSGDPIDVALQKWIANYEEIRRDNPRVWAYPFDTKRRLMATANLKGGAGSSKGDSRPALYVKGAYEELSKMARKGRFDPNAFEDAQNRMASEGLRVLAFGIGEWTSENPDEWEISLVGLVGFLDPPKEGVAEAVKTSKKAGIRVMMITGDYPLTAKAVAKSVGIWNEGDGILTGREMAALNDDDLYSALKKTTVLARFLPEDKYRVVKVLQEKGEIVAVSGDGVNDVPALKIADLGIAMGSGTEAAKSVSKMIILDNNLKVIVDAIERGRVISDNIRKVIYYLLSTNLHQIILNTLAVFAGLPIPLLPIQILWINLVTDGVQDKTFPFTGEEGNVMDRSPKPPGKQFFDRDQLLRVVSFGVIMGYASFELFRYLLGVYSYAVAVSITFTAVVVPQWFNGIQAQKESEPFLLNIRKSFTINKYIFLGAGVGLTLQLLAIYAVPDWFSAVPLTAEHWIYVIMLSIMAFLVVEVRKWFEYFLRRRKN